MLKKIAIEKEYKDGKSTKEISQYFHASISSIYKIMKDSKNLSINADLDSKLDQKYGCLNAEEQNFIKTYVQPPQIPLTIQRIGSELDNLFGVKDRKRDIKYFLKNQINYSYKKGSSTTLRGGSKIIKYQQSIFSSRVLADILNNKLIINIDECVFNRDLKKQYSWLPKGITSPIINTIATGRC